MVPGPRGVVDTRVRDIGGQRTCVQLLDLLQRLYVGVERPNKAVVLIPVAAALSAVDKQLARQYFPSGPPAELRCLPDNVDPRGAKAK